MESAHPQKEKSLVICFLLARYSLKKYLHDFLKPVGIRGYSPTREYFKKNIF